MALQVFSRLLAGEEKWVSKGFDNESALGEYVKYNPKVLEMGSISPVILGFELILEKVVSNKLGRIDFLVDYDKFVAVVELKNGILNETHLDQLNSYLKGKVHLKGMADKDVPDKIRNISKGVLVGTSVDCDLLTHLKKEKNSNISVITVGRYSNNGKIFDIVNSYFSFSIKDYQKFIAGDNPNPQSKARLLSACVEYYLGKHKNVLFDDLEKLVVGVQKPSDAKKYPFILKQECLEDHLYKWAYYKKPFVSGDGVSFVVFNWVTKDDIGLIKAVASNLRCKLVEYKAKV